MGLRVLMATTVAVLLGLATVGLSEETGKQAKASPPSKEEAVAELTPAQQEYLKQVKHLRTQVRIAQLELELLEVKEAPERDIAAKAEQLYALEGKMHALRVKNADVEQGLRRAFRHERRHRHGRGAGGDDMMPGPGRGRGMGRGGRGIGPRARHRGAGGCDLGPGRDPGMGRGGGRGRGAGRWPGWDVPAEGTPEAGPPGGVIPPPEAPPPPPVEPAPQ